MSGYRPIYTVDEDMFILNTIIACEGYYKLKSRALWMDLANTGLIDRTWQSLKERFEKTILPRINSAQYTISPIEKKNIQVAMYQLENNFKGGGSGSESSDTVDEAVEDTVESVDDSPED